MVYNELGIDVETVVRMFLKCAVLEQRLSLGAIVSASECVESASDAKPRRSKGAITKAMAEGAGDASGDMRTRVGVRTR